MASLAARNLTLRRLFKTPSSRASSLLNDILAQQRQSALQQRRHKTTYGTPGEALNERDQKYFEKGWMDERGLTLFKTLHENQVRSCEIYAENPLYGVYNEEKDDFVYSTYKEFGEQVDRARDVLKHLGTFSERSGYLWLGYLSETFEKGGF